VSIDADRPRIVEAARGGGGAYLWRIPEGRPLHTLPHDEFLDRLRAETNRRVVADPTSATGYQLDLDALEGWQALVRP
jgi:hypothetical protein